MDEHATARDRADDSPPVVRLQGPADILGVLPYRLGFHPSESLVLVCLEGRRRRDRLVMRIDLPRPVDDRVVAAELAARVRHVGASAVVAVVYTEATDPRRLPRDRLVTALSNALAEAGVELPEALLVRDGRWWSYLCDRPACCPAEGTPLPAEPTLATTRYAAEAVAQGGAVLADREALRRTVEPADHPVARAARGQAAAAADEVLGSALRDGGLPAVRALTLARLDALRSRWEQGDRRLAADDAALVVLGLRDKQARDEVMTAVLDDDVESFVGLLSELARLTDDLDAAPVCTVLALGGLHGRQRRSRGHRGGARGACRAGLRDGRAAARRDGPDGVAGRPAPGQRRGAGRPGEADRRAERKERLRLERAGTNVERQASTGATGSHQPGDSMTLRPQLFRLDASLAGDTSVSRAVADTFERTWLREHPDGTVLRRDLGAQPVPMIDMTAVGARFTPAADRSPEQQAAVELAETLTDELLASDAYLFAVPLYNWTNPASLQAWVDRIFTAAPLRAGEGEPIAGRPAVVVHSRGGRWSTEPSP